MGDDRWTSDVEGAAKASLVSGIFFLNWAPATLSQAWSGQATGLELSVVDACTLAVTYNAWEARELYRGKRVRSLADSICGAGAELRAKMGATVAHIAEDCVGVRPKHALCAALVASVISLSSLVADLSVFAGRAPDDQPHRIELVAA